MPPSCKLALSRFFLHLPLGILGSSCTKWKIQVENPSGTENFQNFLISGKLDNLKSLNRILEMSLPKFFVPFNRISGDLGLNGTALWVIDNY